MAYPTTNAEKELAAINQILASVGQAPVTTKDSSNPDVAIADETFLYVNREVQAEGWHFNREDYIEFKPDNDKWIKISEANKGQVLQIDLNDACDDRIDAVIRTDVSDGLQKLYNKTDHKFTWDGSQRCDVVYLYSWVDVPVPIQDYIVARAATIVSSRIVGDTQQYQMLQQREAFARSNALEYECRQGDYTFFGHPRGVDSYISYKPYHTLQR